MTNGFLVMKNLYEIINDVRKKLVLGWAYSLQHKQKIIKVIRVKLRFSTEPQKQKMGRGFMI
jgi:hypothetical protein